jgi:hypothetical protein
MSIRSVTSERTVRHPALGIGICAWAAGRDLHHLDPRTGEHRVEGGGELPCAIPDQEPEVADTLAEVHQQIPRLLHRPRAIRIGRDPENVNVAAADFDDEET